MPIHTPCARPNCPEYAEDGSRYCGAHSWVGGAERKERRLRREVRPGRRAAKRVYDDNRWRGPGGTLDVCRRRAGGLCERCGRERPLQGHHVLGITGTRDDFDPELVLMICDGCHPDADWRRRQGYGR